MGGGYTIDKCITLDKYKETKLSNDDIFIYDLRLALDKDTSTINNDKLWEDLESNLTTNISSLVFYAADDDDNDELKTASWKNIILRKDDSSNFPSFSSLVFDGPDEAAMGFYNTVISAKITGWGDLSVLTIDCFKSIYNLDISGNNLFKVDFDGVFDTNNIRSITMRDMIIDGRKENDCEIVIKQPTLEYLDITNTTCNKLSLALDNLKQLIGFTPKTLRTAEIEKEGKLTDVPPSLSLENLKLPIDLSNFPSDISILLYNVNHFPTGLDTIEKIDMLDIDDCKNINEIRDLYINDCKAIYLKYVYKLNKIKINSISDYIVDDENKNMISMIANIDLVSLELPDRDLSNIEVELYANINLSEIIYNGISYGKEDSEKDLVALCEKSRMELREYDSNDPNNANNAINTDTDGNVVTSKHRLGFNKLYINETKRNFYNINPQIYKNRELIGEPLTGSSVNDILKYKNITNSYIQLPKLDTTIDNSDLKNMLLSNVINYNGNDVELHRVGYNSFVAFDLTEYTANSFITNLDQYNTRSIVFTNNPNLFKGLKVNKVINPFNYAPDLPNVFGIKLVVY